MFRYFDIHAHRHYTDSGVVIVENIRLLHDKITATTLFSIGLHPYDINITTANWANELETIASSPNCVAIGECGIDKRFDNVDKQTEILKAQISIAQKLNKPLIIHCVHAESEILKLTMGLQIPIIFHSYPKYGAQIASRENILFSLSNKNINHPDVSKIPASKILFETDNDNMSVKEVYNSYCSTLNLGIEQIGKQIESNFYKTFKIDGTEMERADGVVARQEKY